MHDIEVRFWRDDERCLSEDGEYCELLDITKLFGLKFIIAINVSIALGHKICLS